jgi:hypothetical protein
MQLLDSFFKRLNGVLLLCQYGNCAVRSGSLILQIICAGKITFAARRTECFSLKYKTYRYIIKLEVVSR